MKGDQLALPVQLPQTPCFDNFFAGPNAEVVSALRKILVQASVPAVWLYGARDSGKSHLLRAAVLDAGAGALYISLGDAHARNVVAPASLADATLLALDDVDVMSSDPGRALELLRLIDQRRLRRLPTLLSAAAAPARIDVSLPDLQTRFAAMALLGLQPLRESDRRDLLRLHAQARGLDLGDEAVAWLLTHLQRDPGTLIAALERLDLAALKSKRRLSLAFVQQVLEAPPPAPTSERTSSG